ncbi:MAG: methyltransferase domain-containing protein, partial [Anaerolineales bacterium]|nr:methyltransferase domain-containing protein [Anaerolineales bacterium]
GFSILPAEAGESPKPATPNDLIKRLAEVGDSWQTDSYLRQNLSAAALDLWQDFPDVPRRVIRLWRDPLLNDAGSLTDERDYAAYAYGMSNQEIIAVKYNDIKELLRPGKIVDEGCADGALLAAIARDMPDSDLIGIEITGEFMARARERQRAGGFGGSYVHFHQRNITQPIFAEQTVDTTICNSTIHELFSYGAGETTVHAYLALKYAQTRKGGRLVIRDVVGPTGKGQEVYAWLNRADGIEDDIFRSCADGAALAEHLGGLSTYARFKRFGRDFQAELRQAGQLPADSQLTFREELIDGEPYIVTNLQTIAEYLSKKDYLANWQSEMFESFTFWEFDEWKAALTAAGFHVLENPNDPEQSSRVYCNPWIVANRYEGKVRLYRRDARGALQPLPFPETNIILVGERR